MMTPSTPFAPVSPYGLPPRAERRGDGVAGRRLLAEQAPRVRRVVRAVLGGAHPELEDVEQQALLAFAQALPTFRGECEPAHFASRIAARVALMAARRTRAARARQDDGVEVDELASAAQPHDDLVRHRRTDRVRELLARLAPEQAETLTLRVVLGWSLPEVAAATGAPLNTVRSRIRLAKEALRAAIARDPRLAEELGSPARSGEPGASDDG
jgi:RNA polymerase sigma-70 factor (ECF subfamily)